MCGIMGYVGSKNCTDIIYEGLRKLEYRGYDSAGIAVLEKDKISLIKSEGKLSKLEPMLRSLPQEAKLGMGHTRWATHGVPSTKNAHPHMEQGVAIIHNGILENYQELKIELLEEGVKFLSDTDSEVVVHLLHRELKIIPDVRKAILNLLPRFKGAYALGIIATEDPEAMYLIKHGSPMVVGVGKGESFFASDALALAPHTNQVLFLEDGQIARISKDQINLWDFDGANLDLKPVTIEWSNTSSEKGGYRHFMIKEIHDQAQVVASTIKRLCPGFQSGADFNYEDLGLDGIETQERIVITGCGTAYYAGMVGKYLLESWLRIPVEVELASELRYRSPILNNKTLFIAMTQSGETADTLACVKLAKSMGAHILSICNVKYSSIPRESHHVLYMEAGSEIGVASTKAYTSMILNLYLFTLAYSRKLGRNSDGVTKSLDCLRRLPALIDQTLSYENQIAILARRYFEAPNFLFVGRGMNYPIALEGSLKLKEITYIHAEGYAGGELKHGPIALIDEKMPIIAIVPNDKHYDKMLSNVEEIKARKGKIIGVGASQNSKMRALSDDYIPCPDIDDEFIVSLLSVLPLQLFSYYVALLRGTDVDQPRNLAKSVTVE
jgi:glucosamine--fructose-6-phosphate aminotransferase (isomerizing)